MELTIATINELLLPPFLFVTTFCFLCCQLNSNNRHTFATTQQQPLFEPVTSPQLLEETETTEEIQSPLATPQAFEPEVMASEPPAVEEELATPFPDPIAFLESKIDLSKLSLRACRHIAGRLTEIDSYRLGISQKVNGADKPASQLVAEVKNRLKKDPATVAPVVLEFANPTALRSQDEAHKVEVEIQVQAS